MHSQFRKSVFYKQVLDFHCPSKILSHTSGRQNHWSPMHNKGSEVHLPPLNLRSTKYIYIKSTKVYVPSSELELSQHLSRQRECPSPQNQRGEGAHSPAGEGLGESQFRRLEKSLALSLLCAQIIL